MLLHDGKSEENVKGFFAEVHELYIKVGPVSAPLLLPGGGGWGGHPEAALQTCGITGREQDDRLRFGRDREGKEGAWKRLLKMWG
jgi:hypothetical protein